MVSGRCFVSEKMFARYAPIIPRKEIINPPRIQTETIMDVQPSRACAQKNFRATRYKPYPNEPVKIHVPTQKIILRGYSLKPLGPVAADVPAFEAALVKAFGGKREAFLQGRTAEPCCSRHPSLPRMWSLTAARSRPCCRKSSQNLTKSGCVWTDTRSRGAWSYASATLSFLSFQTKTAQCFLPHRWSRESLRAGRFSRLERGKSTAGDGENCSGGGM